MSIILLHYGRLNVSVLTKLIVAADTVVYLCVASGLNLSQILRFDGQFGWCLYHQCKGQKLAVLSICTIF